MRKNSILLNLDISQLCEDLGISGSVLEKGLQTNVGLQRDNLRELGRQYYAFNREKRLAQKKTSNSLRREVLTQYMRAYRSLHKEELNAKRREYYSQHKEEMNARRRARRARKKAENANAALQNAEIPAPAQMGENSAYFPADNAGK